MSFLWVFPRLHHSDFYVTACKLHQYGPGACWCWRSSLWWSQWPFIWGRVRQHWSLDGWRWGSQLASRVARRAWDNSDARATTTAWSAGSEGEVTLSTLCVTSMSSVVMGGDSCIILLIMCKTLVSVLPVVFSGMPNTRTGPFLPCCSKSSYFVSIPSTSWVSFWMIWSLSAILVLRESISRAAVFRASFYGSRSCAITFWTFSSVSLSVNASSTESFTTVFRSSGSIFTLESSVVAIVEDLNLPLHIGHEPSQ